MKQYSDFSDWGIVAPHSAPLPSLFVIALYVVILLASFPLLCAHRKMVCLGIEYLKRKRQVSPMHAVPSDIRKCTSLPRKVGTTLQRILNSWRSVLVSEGKMANSQCSYINKSERQEIHVVVPSVKYQLRLRKDHLYPHNNWNFVSEFLWFLWLALLLAQ